MNWDLNNNDLILGVLAAGTWLTKKDLRSPQRVVSGWFLGVFLGVVRDDGTLERALGYVANGPDEGAPRPGYLQRILTGARHHDLPAAAITEVESLNQQWA